MFILKYIYLWFEFFLWAFLRANKKFYYIMWVFYSSFTSLQTMPFPFAIVSTFTWGRKCMCCFCELVSSLISLHEFFKTTSHYLSKNWYFLDILLIFFFWDSSNMYSGPFDSANCSWFLSTISFATPFPLLIELRNSLTSFSIM